MARGPDPYGKSSLVLSVMLHGGLVALGWVTGLHKGPEVMEFVAYEIEMVSPPPAAQAEEPVAAREEFVVERPDAEPPAPEVEEVVTVEEPDPEPEPPPPEPEPTPPPPEPEPPAPEPEEEPVTAASPEAPNEEAEESGEDINVRLEGVRRDYPQYYRNIILQIQRCFRWQGGGNWETTVYFVIRRDGTVADLEFQSRSGSAAFDFEAMGAVDCAGRGNFGPLPEDLPYERLPVQFNFRPTGSARVQIAAADMTRANLATRRGR